jgi:hypothetical protein
VPIFGVRRHLFLLSQRMFSSRLGKFVSVFNSLSLLAAASVNGLPNRFGWNAPAFVPAAHLLMRKWRALPSLFLTSRVRCCGRRHIFLRYETT